MAASDATVKQALYEKAVAWIALNDETSGVCYAEIKGLISVQLASDVFNVHEDVVVHDVIRYRNQR